MIDDRPRPPAFLRARHRTLRAIGALAFAVALVVEPGGVATPAGGRSPVLAEPAAEPVPAAASRPIDPADGWPDAAPDAIADVDATDASATPDAIAEPDGQPAEGVQEPSIIAIDAAAHEHDRVVFAPGGLVDVPFSPRVDDGWSVGGVAPRRLPAGASSGRMMASTRQGSVWAPASSAAEARATGDGDPAATAPIDAPRRLPARPATAVVPASFDVAARTGREPLHATDLRRQVFGFLPYWQLNDRTTRLDYRLLSTIAYFGVGAGPDGDLLKRDRHGSISTGWSGWTSARLGSIIKAAHQRRTRVVLTVQSFAWTSNQAGNQDALLGSPAARLRLARQIAAAVRDRGADGVNLDFEPLVSGRADEFTALVRTIRTELNRLARGYQLTFDTTGWIGNYPIEAATAPGGADAIFIMGYDYRTAKSSSAGSVAPLTGAGYDLRDTVEAFTDRVPASKLILGVPYYGRAWSTTTDRPRATTQTGEKYGWSAPVTYANAVTLAAEHGRRYDRGESSAWTAYRRRTCTRAHGCQMTWREVYYDDAQSLGAKYDLINRYGLRGAGIWALGYDGTRPELYRTIVARFLHDTTPPETGIGVLAPRQGDEGFLVGWSALDLNPIRDYDVQVSVDGGPWRTWLTRTRATDAIWLGRNGHGYAFRARATDARGNRGRWDIASLPAARPVIRPGGFAVVRAATLTMRSRPDTTGAPVATLKAGAIVAVTGGPVRADGYSWYQVAGPLRTWATTTPVRTGNWVAASGSSAYLVPRTPPNTTIVDAGLSGLSFGDGHAASVGPAGVAPLARVFSPNRDHSQDVLTLRWTNGVPLDAISLRVLRANGTTVGTRSLPNVGRGSQVWAWDGAVNGRILVDGRYVLQLIGRAGTRTFSAPSIRPMTPAQVAAYAVTIDTIGPRLTAASSAGWLISPLVDGRHDSVSVTARSTGATHWRLTAARLSGTTVGAVVRTIHGVGGAPRTSWNGRTDGAAPAPDGRYRLTLAVLDPAGNFAARSWTVVVDGTAPSAVLGAAPAVFSPDGDGLADSSLVAWTGGEPAVATARISRGTKLVRIVALAGARAAGSFRWNGRTGAGAPLPDATYQVRITLEDAAGNRRTTLTAVRIDRTAGWLRWTPSAFYPQDRDGLARAARATYRLGRPARTTLQVVGADGTVIRTIWSGRSQVAGAVGWTWDGRASSGAMVAPGNYVLVLTATGATGTTILRRSIVVDAFVIQLSATRLRVGRHLTVRFSSVEALGSRPTVTFDQTGRPPVTRHASLIGPGRYAATFLVRAGRGPAIIRFDATDSGGQRNASARSLWIE